MRILLLHEKLRDISKNNFDQLIPPEAAQVSESICLNSKSVSVHACSFPDPIIVPTREDESSNIFFAPLFNNFKDIILKVRHKIFRPVMGIKIKSRG